MDYLAKANAVIEELAAGDSTLKKLFEKHGIGATKFFRLTRENPNLGMAYAHAQHSRAEMQVDEINEIADTETDANRARVRIDARKWVASKLKPEKFGDRIDLNVNGTVDIRGALAEAAKRAALSNHSDIVDAQVIETKELTDQSIENANTLSPDDAEGIFS